jgi:hypothetical protein
MRGIKSGGSGGGKATIKVGVEVGLQHGCGFVGFEFDASVVVAGVEEATSSISLAGSDSSGGSDWVVSNNSGLFHVI